MLRRHGAFLLAIIDRAELKESPKTPPESLKRDDPVGVNIRPGRSICGHFVKTRAGACYRT
jgi:hypothetical protein